MNFIHFFNCACCVDSSHLSFFSITFQPVKFWYYTLCEFQPFFLIAHVCEFQSSFFFKLYFSLWGPDTICVNFSHFYNCAFCLDSSDLSIFQLRFSLWGSNTIHCVNFSHFSITFQSMTAWCYTLFKFQPFFYCALVWLVLQWVN